MDGLGRESGNKHTHCCNQAAFVADDIQMAESRQLVRDGDRHPKPGIAGISGNGGMRRHAVK